MDEQSLVDAITAFTQDKGMKINIKPKYVITFFPEKFRKRQWLKSMGYKK